MKTQSVIGGAFILSVASVFAKIFSAIYRIFLTRILGGVGIGLYQLVFPFYSLCVVFVTAGIPMAVSKIVSKTDNHKVVLKKSLIYSIVVALVVTFILLISSGGIASIQGEKKLTLCYIILAPSLIFISAVSVLRGYFQGRHNFVPTAISNIVEQVIKLVLGLFICLALVKINLYLAIVGAMVTILISEIMALFVVMFFFKKREISTSEEDVSYKQIIKEILPITITNIILPIAGFIDSILVVNLLRINFSQTSSVFMYGVESGAISSLINLPTIFSFAIASVLLPNLAGDKHIKNKAFKLSIAIKIVLVICVPCVVCFLLVPNKIITVLYGNNLNMVSGSAFASSLLALSGLGVVFLAVNQLLSSSLQAIDKSYITIRNLIIGVVIKFVIQLLYLPSKGLNIYALSLANTVCYIIVMALNYLEIKQTFKLKIECGFVVKLVLCNIAMLLSLLLVLSISSSVICIFIAFVVAVVVYLISVFVFKVIKKQDLAISKYKTK